MRVGAIAFGLGTMVYNGLEFGSYFEIPGTSKCYSHLLAINPVLQMIFTFAQMYFIFMNARVSQSDFISSSQKRQHLVTREFLQSKDC